ncbi:MAG: polymer-forming cytoskeletal protein [Ferrovibrio sp.]|uniref:bactofilin family protein n=1 Tax=Ferrovibrio sp. TaxID=1917215 RepID=UPI0026064E6C|nr:polymer-forming cytoskeletal protein [Ferrovibrio sp.]MCW0234114.1 polymer-forming cytoskeletal protein [Ferrovibrio sp.]
MFGRKKPSTDSAAMMPPAPPAQAELKPIEPKQPEKAVAPIKAVDDELPPMPSHLRAVGKPVLPATAPVTTAGAAAMSDTNPPTPTFRPEIAKRPMDLAPKAVVHATAGAAPAVAARSDTHAEPKVLLIGREISLSGQITACDKVVVEGRVEAQLTESRFVEITETGQFKGSAEVEEAEIRGRFEGRLSVRGRLLIRGTGKVSGEIAYGQVEIECGGEISGTVQTVASGGRLASPAAAE